MFTVDNNTSESNLKFFGINREEDFIQKDVTIRNIEVENTNWGKKLKVTIGKDDAETDTWVCDEPGEDRDYNGKTITKEMQIATVTKVIAHIGRKFLGGNFKATGVTFDEIVGDLVSQTKTLWDTTKLNAKLELKNGYTNLAKWVPFLELPGEDKLYVSDKDREALAEKLKTAQIKSDSEDTEETTEKDVF